MPKYVLPCISPALGTTSITQSVWETSSPTHQTCDLSILSITLTRIINCSKSKCLLEMVEWL